MNTFFVGNHPVGHYVKSFASPRPAPPPGTATTKKSHASEDAPLKQELARSNTMVDGEKTFFMKARIMAGQADLSASSAAKEGDAAPAADEVIEDFKWLSKEEVQKHVRPDYWARIKNMLVAQ